MSKIYRRYSKRALFSLAVCFCLAMMTGCTVGPDYKAPEPNVTVSWSGPFAPSDSNQAETLVNWWTTFGDPNLTSLVTRSIQSNLSLKQAQSRILQARAARGIVASGLWPAADATGSISRSRSATTGVTRNLYQAGLDATWEADMFGGIRRDIEAANADIRTEVENLRDVLVTLTAEVALNYIDLRGLQQEIVIARQNLNAQKHSAELTRKRFMGGFVGALDVANADALVATTASLIPLLEADARQTIYNMSVLLALEPAALLEELSTTSAIPSVPPSVPVGIPADLLRRRPDIRRAEAQIHAATVRIGVATADLFPKITLSASGGLQSNKFSSLTDWSSRFWSVGPGLDWRIFDAGQISYNIKLQKAIQEESLIVYRQTVLAALQDVENALILSAKEQEHRAALVDAVAANRKAVKLATQLYTEGQTDFLNVLDAQRSLFSSEDALVRSTSTVSTNLVALYKALGGGWSEE